MAEGRFESLRRDRNRATAERVVSLIPSATEIVCALGMRHALVGRSHECDFPAGLDAVPVCTASKLEVDGTSYAIDERIKALVQEGLSMYRVSTAQLNALAPDVILTQSQCDVCAVSLSDVNEAVHAMVGSKPHIVALEPAALDAVYSDILHVGEALGLPEAGIALTDEMQRRMAAVERKTASLGPTPAVAAIEWMDPLMAGGNWMPTLIEKAGGRNLFGAAGGHSPWLDWEAVAAADPDILLLLPCGWGIEETRADLASLTQRAGWSDLAAVRNGRVYLLDGNQYFNRPGPRLADSVEILAEVFWPETYAPVHRGTGWVNL